jgi:hypothetical protein
VHVQLEKHGLPLDGIMHLSPEDFA